MVNERPIILIVDDEPDNLDLLETFLSEHEFDIIRAVDGKDGLEKVFLNNPDVVITDGIMPNLNGFEMTMNIRSNSLTKLLPVIMVTTLNSQEDRIRGIEKGVNDFISRPFDLFELLARVKSLVSLKLYTDELENAEKVIFSLANAVESRDEYTGGHCQRMADIGKKFGIYLGLTEESIKNIIRGGFLHDIGKIMVSDQILLKRGALTEEEWVIMRKHPEEGEKICKPLRSLKNVIPIIRWHQERWDGSGYPDGLKEKEIPLLTRIVSIVDFYDALTTERPYRRALSDEEAFLIMRQETKQGKWDPELMEKFIQMIIEESRRITE